MNRCFYYVLLGLISFYWHANGMDHCSHADCIQHRHFFRKQICLYVGNMKKNESEFELSKRIFLAHPGANCMLENEISMEKADKNNFAQKQLEKKVRAIKRGKRKKRILSVKK